MINYFYNFIFVFVLSSFSLPVYSRCAVCYTQGLSGASIAVIVILSAALFLFLGNMILNKFLNKEKI